MDTITSYSIWILGLVVVLFAGVAYGIHHASVRAAPNLSERARVWVSILLGLPGTAALLLFALWILASTLPQDI